MADKLRDIGIVAIGRNEGDRLKRCLRSAIACTDHVVYVDSGSDDDSVSFAESIGVEVVDLDTSIPFTAARARNEGIARLSQKWDGLRFVQVLDGDCELRDGWVQIAREFLESNPNAAVVCGRRRERHPEQTAYNHLCDLEWDTPIGQARSCGGDALFRLEAFDSVGGYNPCVIAGEEPELCVRLRHAGYEVYRIDHEMTWHDAAMVTLGQYWKRAKRAGHAYAEGAYMHGMPPERHNVKPTRSAITWGLLLPMTAVVLAFFTYAISLLIYIMLIMLQMWRIRKSELRRGRTRRDAAVMAKYIMIAKFAQAQGVLLFHWRRLTRKQAKLIEYKGATQGGATNG
jgi:GT2 family glycosyltransferase